VNKQKWIMLVVALVLIGGTAGLLAQLRAHQRLGAPGVKTEPLDDPVRVQVVLPERVLNYTSKFVEVEELTRKTLPADTSFGQRRYEAPDGFSLSLNVVLMGRDRTSMHKPQFCLTGAGWNIDQAASKEDAVSIERPHPYKLPVVKLLSSRQVEQNGRVETYKGIYVYWFVADGAMSASVTGFERMWWMMSHMARTGELQRWAYISCFAVCRPGQEDAVYSRMKEFMTAAVPEFQLTGGQGETVIANK
jgi:hypothetical protein